MDASQLTEPVVVEPVVNLEKLRELLALGAEYSTLDFKSTSNLKATPDRVELAKDIGAMSVRGGYIVIGADDKGRPTGSLTEEQAALFDEARLRPMMLKWLPETLEVTTGQRDIDGSPVALIYVAPNPQGCAFFRADGQYEKAGKPVTVFRRGDVFFREGTQSARLTQAGHEEVIRRRVMTARDQWRAEQASTNRHLAEELRSGVAGQQVTRGSAAEFHLGLENAVLTDAAIELLRSNDDIPIRLLLRGAVLDLHTRFAANDTPGLTDGLDKLTCLASIFLDLERVTWFNRTVETIAGVYSLGFERDHPQAETASRETASLWLEIIKRIEALGALAVRLQNWEAVRLLVTTRPPRMEEGYYQQWLRHGLVKSARAGLMADEQASPESQVSLLSLAREVIRQLQPLRPDIPANDERVTTSLAQFDFLAGVVAADCIEIRAAAGSWEYSSRLPYPSFARFYSARTAPIAVRLLDDQAMRSTLYHSDDVHLAAALEAIGRSALDVSRHFDGWESYPNEVTDFIERHITQQPT